MATVRTVRTQGGRARSSSVSETYIHPLMLPARFHKHAELQATFCVQIFQNTNLVHNSFILQQYICYTTLLNMFRAARCSSSGGQIVSPQPLVSSLFTNSRILYGCLQRVTIPEAMVIQLILLMMSSVLFETC